MKIDLPSFQFQPIDQPQGPSRQRKPETSQQIEKKSFPKEEELQAPELNKVVVPKSPGIQKNEISPPLSKYLNQEEKEMLNRLFPENGSEFGVNAYRKGQGPAQTQRTRGQRIDLTT